MTIGVAPPIETARLRLRPHCLSDLAARGRMTAEPETMRHIGGVQPEEENHARILRYAGQWALCGFGAFAVEARDGGHFIGEVGLAPFHRGLGDDFDGVPEALWVLARQAAGQGFAFEAMTAALDWHDRRFGAVRSVCIIAPDNMASLRLATRLGFRPYREARYHDRPVVLHERTPPLPNGARGG